MRFNYIQSYGMAMIVPATVRPSDVALDPALLLCMITKEPNSKH